MHARAIAILGTIAALTAGLASPAGAQDPQPPTREAEIEQAKTEKAKALHPYEPNGFEVLMNRAEDALVNGVLRWHPFFASAYYRGGLEVSQWSVHPGEGDHPSVDDVYTPQTLPGVGARTTYVHSQGTVGFDWRESPGYSRRGGYYAVTLHDYADRDSQFGLDQVDYEAIQHVPILREAWVISLRALARTTYAKTDQAVPFFLLPYVGSGHTLRGFTSHRFRDQNGLVLNAEWRIMVNRFMATAFFYDTGKVAARRADLDLNGLKSDYGFGFRLHGAFATPLRIELAN